MESHAPDEVKNGEKERISSSKPTAQTKLDETVRNAVSHIFSSTANGKEPSKNSHEADCRSEYSAIDIDDENDETTMNCDATANEDGSDGQFIRSEVVTNQHQCRQQFMLQAIDGLLVGIREEVVTTTTTTTESRSEQNEPAKRKAEEDCEEQPLSKRRFSVDRSVQTDSELKPISKRRCSLAERKFYNEREKEEPGENQKSLYESRKDQSTSDSKQRLKQRRFSMHERAFHTGTLTHSFSQFNLKVLIRFSGSSSPRSFFCQIATVGATTIKI